MKKKLSLILAFLMAASIMAGCKKTEENVDGLPDVTTPTASITQMTPASEDTTTTEAETTTEDTTTEETTESETETTTASETTSSATTTATAATAASAREWNETEISETLYIKTACYSRTKAIVGSESVKKYSPGTKINVVAATDTGYYKLADGTFIHSDYVTDEAPSAETTTKKPVVTTTEDAGLIIEDATTISSSSTPSAIDGKHPKNFKDRYPYKQLSEAEKTLYSNILTAAYSFNNMTDIPQGLESDQIYRVYSMVYDNEPQLFWLARTVPSVLGGTLVIDYTLTKGEAEKYQTVIDKNTKEIMKSVNGYSSTISKLKVIYDWVILNSTFDEASTGETSTILNSLGGKGTLQCQGYAKTFLYLCDYAGIECMTVPGKNPEGASHAWNIVYCDNGYYIVDTTWGDPKGANNNSKYITYLFFLANDDMIKSTHLSKATMTRNSGTVVKIFDPPACTKSSCYYFKAYNKEYSDFNSAKQAILDDIAAAVKENRNVVHIRVTDHDTWEKLLTTDMAVEFQKYARGKSSNVEKITRQRARAEDALVVQYDIVYK